MVGFPNTVR